MPYEMRTKRNWFVLTLAFCCIFSSHAQSVKYFAGLKSGFGIPNLTAGSKTTPLSEGYSSRLGFYGGLVAEVHPNDRFGLRAEINYSSQGGQRAGLQALPVPPELEPLWQALPVFGVTPDNYMYADIKSVAILNYLEIPVLAKFTFNLSPGIHFYLQAGPYLGILLNAKDVTSGTSLMYIDKDGTLTLDAILAQVNYPGIGPQSFDNTQDITSDVHRLNAGGQGTAGFEMDMGTGKLFLEGGGNYGFISIQKDEANGTNNTGAGTVTLGYLFQF
jgi:hypothetical protein